MSFDAIAYDHDCSSPADDALCRLALVKPEQVARDVCVVEATDDEHNAIHARHVPQLCTAFHTLSVLSTYNQPTIPSQSTSTSWYF